MNYYFFTTQSRVEYTLYNTFETLKKIYRKTITESLNQVVGKIIALS